MKVQKIRITVWSATCKVKVQQFSTTGDKLEDAAVGDVLAASHLEVLQGGTVLAEQSQSSISQPEEEIDGCNRRVHRNAHIAGVPQYPLGATLTGRYLAQPERTTVVTQGAPSRPSLAQTSLLRIARTARSVSRDSPASTIELQRVSDQHSWRSCLHVTETLASSLLFR